MDKRKKTLFTIITYSIPFAFFILLEFGLRLSNYGHEYPLFVEDPVDNNYLYMNRDVSLRYFSDAEFATVGQYDVFRKTKDKNTFRVVVQGASTSAGFPYNHSLSFPRLLEQKLQFAYPEKNIEVINTSMSAVNSFTLLDFADEIIAQSPDLVLIYAGHNEYYGALGVGSSQKIGGSYFFTSFYLKFKNFKTLQLLKNIIASFSSKPKSIEEGQTLMDRMVENEGIPYDSDAYRQGIDQYRSNISKLLKKYQRAGVEVLISTLVSNLRDHEPFKSDDTSEYNAIRSYENGLYKEREGDYSNSLKSFTEARDYDLLKFRAPTAIQEVIIQMASEFDIELVQLEGEFTKNSPNGIIGKSLLLEHVHPNIEGQKIMANVFFNHVASRLGPNSIATSNFQFNYTKLDSMHGQILVSQLMTKWPFTERKVVNVETETDQNAGAELINKLISNEVTWVQAMDIAFLKALESDHPEALKLAKSLRQEYPHVLQPYVLLAKSYERLGQINLAAQTLLTVPRELSTIEVAEELMRIYVRSGDFNLAMKYAKEVSRVKVNNNNKLKVLALEDINNAGIGTSGINELINSTERDLLVRASGALIFIERSDIASDLLLSLDKKYPNNPDITDLKKQLK